MREKKFLVASSLPEVEVFGEGALDGLHIRKIGLQPLSQLPAGDSNDVEVLPQGSIALPSPEFSDLDEGAIGKCEI